MRLSLAALFLTFAISSNVANAKSEGLDPLFTKTDTRLKVQQTEPSELESLISLTDWQREPASLNRNKKSPPRRRSKIPASIKDGLELRVRYNGLTSVFWVVSRDERYELIYVNSAKSRSSLTLSADVFRQFHVAAGDLPKGNDDLKACKEAYLQLHVVNSGRPEKTLSACAHAKHRRAEGLRQLSQALAIMVR